LKKLDKLHHTATTTQRKKIREELVELEKLEKLETNKERGCFHNESILFFTYE